LKYKGIDLYDDCHTVQKRNSSMCMDEEGWVTAQPHTGSVKGYKYGGVE